jgi:hypothetical protein
MASFKKSFHCNNGVSALAKWSHSKIDNVPLARIIIQKKSQLKNSGVEATIKI